MAGICNTDMEILSGMIDFSGILGHEFVGRVVKDSKGELEGKRVVGEINIPCYQCERCENNQFKHCKNIKTLGMRNKDGVFAKYLTLPRENVHIVPQEVSDREAVFVEPIAAAVEIVEQYHIKPTFEILILGDGKLGLITARTLWALGFSVKVVGHHQEKLSTLDDMNIETVFEKELSEEMDIPVIIEATGSSSGLKKAVDLVAPEGKIIYKTTTAQKLNVSLAKIAINEIKLLGSRCGPFSPALRLLKNNDLCLEKLITAVYPLGKGLKAFKRAREKSSLKILLKP